jgi:hypothetical protein
MLEQWIFHPFYKIMQEKIIQVVKEKFSTNLSQPIPNKKGHVIGVLQNLRSKSIAIATISD